MIVVPSLLTAQAFAPFGSVLSRPDKPGRNYYDSTLENTRSDAKTSLSIVHILPLTVGILDVTTMERHPYSSQTFLPLNGGRWLIVVCPTRDDGTPDSVNACAFLADSQQAISYRSGTWHHSLTVLDMPACYGVIMWRDNSPGDEEFVDVKPFSVKIPPAESTK
jgi:ureidoglycolate lyase